MGDVVRLHAASGRRSASFKPSRRLRDSANNGECQRHGTPRCIHFFKAASDAPSALPHSATAARLSVLMPMRDTRDHLSPLSSPNGVGPSRPFHSGERRGQCAMSNRPTPEQMRAVIQSRVIRARTSLGYSQAEMAKLLGVGLERYKKWENRHNSVMPAEYMDLFCTIVRMSARDLVTSDLDANDRALFDPARKSA